MKKNVLLQLTLMFFIPLLFIMGINQTTFALTYTKLTNGTASASSWESATYAPSKAFDSNTSTKWKSAAVLIVYPDYPPTQSLIYQLPTPKIVQQCTVSGANAAWTLQGSNNGSAWTDIPNVSSNTTPYLYYQISSVGYVVGTQTAYDPFTGQPYEAPFYQFMVSEFELYAVNLPAATFSANPTTINIGGSSTLTWDASEASSVSFSPAIGSTALTGSIVVSPAASTTYTLYATNVAGTSTSTATVNIAAPTVTFAASVNPINSGGSSTLSWTTTNATSVSFVPDIGSTALNGSKVVTPLTNTGYTIYATGPGGTVSQTATVNIVPTINFTADPANMEFGSSSTLSWTTTNATSISINQGIGYVDPVGSRAVHPASSTIYTISAHGAGGSATQSVTVIVIPYATFTANPVTINPGETSILNWSTINATSVSFSPAIGSTALYGTIGVSPSTNTTYTMTVTGEGGPVTRTATVNIVPTSTFAANPAVINSGSSSILSWTTTNATSVSIDHGIGVVSNNSITVTPTATTTYTLSVTGLGGVATDKTVTVTVYPQPTGTFSANPTSIQSGSSSTLTWSTTNAASVSIDHGIGAVATSGTINVSPLSSTTYTMTITGSGGAIVYKTAKVNVVLPPNGSTFTYDELGRIKTINRVK